MKIHKYSMIAANSLPDNLSKLKSDSFVVA